MNIIILGDKYQKRMKSKGCVGLIKYNNKNIFIHQYKTIRSVFPKAHIVYVYGFDSKRFVSYVNKNITDDEGLKLIHNSKYETHNNVYSLNLVAELLNDHCIIFFGDNIIKPSIFNNFHTTKESQIFINKKTKTRLGCIINNNQIANISYDLDNYLSEVYYISKHQINQFKELVSNPKNHNNFIFEIFNKMIDMNQSIIPFSTVNKQYA